MHSVVLRRMALVAAVWLIVGLLQPARAETQGPLPPDRAFSLSVQRSPAADLLLTWKLAPNIYLYRDKFEIRGDDGAAVRVALPAGEIKDDPNFGVTEILRERVQIVVPAAALKAKGSISVTYQGCAERGICYPPVEKTLDLATLAVREAKARDFSSATPPPLSIKVEPRAPAAQGAASSEATLLTGAAVPMLLAFFGLGLLLAFTPCVFPMIPILSGILVRSGGSSAARALSITGAYILAMATAYASLGVVAAWSGQNLQIALQTPVAILVISAVFVALALSMFGLFELQLPAWTLPSMSTSGLSGSIASAALIGFGSALIVGPCVTPPLAAALLYVAQTGDAGRGASALFALGLGMGAPLLAFGLFGPRVLPRSGPWLVRIKHVFGFVFIALAIWTASRIAPVFVTWTASSIWIVALGLYIARTAGGALPSWSSLRGQLTLLVLVLVGIGLPAFVVQDSGDAARATLGSARETTVRTSEALDSAVAAARSAGRPVFVSFSADWCIECKLLERNVFGAADVQQHMRDFQVIHADVTSPSSDSMALMKRFDVVGPPTMFFLDAGTGAEIGGSRSIGSISADAFIARIPKGRS